MCVCVCGCMCTSKCVFLCVCTCTSVYVCLCLCMCKSVRVCVCVCVYICVRVYVHAYLGTTSGKRLRHHGQRQWGPNHSSSSPPGQPQREMGRQPTQHGERRPLAAQSALNCCLIVREIVTVCISFDALDFNSLTCQTVCKCVLVGSLRNIYLISEGRYQPQIPPGMIGRPTINQGSKTCVTHKLRPSLLFVNSAP